MRFYKLNGVWQSWDYLHNELGYAEHETRPTVFKSCADATWGEDAGNGYYDGDVNDMINGTFWTDADPTGWFSLDGLVWNSETYPADASPSLLVKDGVASDALVITCDDGNYYLIRAIIDTTAWIPESEVEALGWRSPSFVVVDSTTGKVVSGCNQELTTYELPSVILNGEDGFETYELPSISLAAPKMVIGVPISGPVQAFWLTENGRDETENKQFNLGNPLYTESGERAYRDVYGDYVGAVPLSFMEYDGDMFLPDPDADNNYVRHVNNTLNLTIRNAASIRSKSAWSVQFAKLFVLSYANTQLPDVQIELPINEVGTYGTSITLPTIDGEYESGGKTWKPSAWDIGAFGSSYSLTADTVAHLVFTEVVQYTEITLYMASGNKNAQTGVTSSYTGNVNANCCYPLYTDAECTTWWNGYGYSNDYALYYGDAPFDYQSIADLPSTTTSSGAKMAFVLMDTGYLWLASNVISSGYATASLTSFTLRIYPKGQQHYAFYSNSTNLYDNASLSNGNIDGLKGARGISSAQTVPWGVQDSTLPVRTIVKILGAAGNELSLTGLDWRDPSLGYNFYQLANNSGSSISYRSVIFTLSAPTEVGYTNTAGSDDSVGTTAVPLYKATGGKVDYDPAFSYRVIGIFKANGNAANGIWSNVNNLVLSDDGAGKMTVKRNSGSGILFNKVWYIKTPIS